MSYTMLSPFRNGPLKPRTYILYIVERIQRFLFSLAFSWLYTHSYKTFNAFYGFGLKLKSQNTYTCTFLLRDIAAPLITWHYTMALWSGVFLYRYQRMHWIWGLWKPVHHQWRSSRAQSSMSRRGHVHQHHWVVPLQVQAGLLWWWKVMFV